MEIKEAFKKAGIKHTLQRRIVYEIMQDLGHAPVEDVIKRVQQHNPSITVATVYRVLDSLHKAGLLSQMNHPNGKCYFDVTPSEHHHVFIGNSRVVDYFNEELTELVKSKLREDFFSNLDVEKITIQIFAKNIK